MQSNAVAQFETWSREEGSFRSATAQADRERQRLEDILSQLRQQQKKLSSDTRESSDLLGRFHRELGLLRQEKERLHRQLKEERVMLEQCARDTEDIISQENMAKKVFCKEVESLNSDLAESLSHQEDHSFQTMMCLETVTELIEFLSKSDQHESNSEIITEFVDSLKRWVDAATIYENQMKERTILKENVDTLRSRASRQVSKENKGIVTEMVLEEMERAWEAEEEATDKNSLFYGEAIASQDDDSMVD